MADRTRRIDAAGESELVEREVHEAPLTNPGKGGGLPDVAETSARRARAVRLKLSGLTYEQIAHELGYSSAGAVRHLVVRALERVEARAVHEYRDLQHARLERVHAALWPLVIGAHTPTRVLPDGRTEPDPSYVDPDTRIKAAGMILRNAERTSKLLGLDAPQRLEVDAGAQAKLEDALLALREAVAPFDTVPGEVVSRDDDTGADTGRGGPAAGSASTG